MVTRLKLTGRWRLLTEPSEYKCAKFETVSEDCYPTKILPYECVGTFETAFSFILKW